MSVFIRTLILGTMTGTVYAVASTGLVLTYKASGVLNFGYGSVAVFTTFVHWQMTETWGLPVWLSAVIVVGIVAPLIGLFLDEALFSKIRGQPMVISVIATVGLTVLFKGIIDVVWEGETKRVPSLFPQGTLRLGGGINIGYDELAVFLVAGAAAAALALMFRYTRAGVAFRAVVDNRPVAGLMAINTRLVSNASWALGTAFAALTGVLLTPQLTLDPNFLPFFIIAQVLGAAVVGYMRSLPLAFAGGILLGVVQGLIIQYTDFGGVLANLRFAVPFIFVIVAVLVAPKAMRVAGLGASFIVRAREKVSIATPAQRTATGVAYFAILALIPVITGGSSSWLLAMTRAGVVSMFFLSLVILTGYSGQISLGHTAFMGISAYTAAHLAQGPGGVNEWLALLIGVAAAIPAGALIGVIAVRLHGLFLALITLAFAFMAQELFFQDVSVSGGLSGVPLDRPGGFTGDRAFYWLVVAALAGLCIVAINLRNGRTGRVLAAMRDSETAARALGINVLKYKVVIFALSAAVVGTGSVLASMTLRNVGQRDFVPFLGIFFVALAVVGGIFHVGGALTVGLLYGLYPPLLGDHFEVANDLQFILFGLGATLGLADDPEGAFGIARRAGNGILRLVQRARAGPPAAQPLPVSGGQE